MAIKFEVPSEKGAWVFTYVPAGETYRVLDKDVPFKPFAKDVDVIQAHVLNSPDYTGQIIGEMPVTRFLTLTAELKTPAAVHKFFRRTNDSIEMVHLAAVLAWVKNEGKRQVRAANEAAPKNDDS